MPTKAAVLSVFLDGVLSKVNAGFTREQANPVLFKIAKHASISILVFNAKKGTVYSKVGICLCVNCVNAKNRDAIHVLVMGNKTIV